MTSKVRAYVVICLAATLCRELVGQGSVTVPTAMTGVEGGSGSSVPFGFGQAARFMCVYDQEELPFSGPRLISVVSLRADNNVPNSTTFNGKGFIDLTMKLSTSAVKAENASAVFDDNHGVDLMAPLERARIMLPFQPPQAGPRTANIDFVLPVPWIYGLTPVRPGEEMPDSLVFELQIHSQPAGAYRLDALSNCSSNPTQIGAVTAECASLDSSVNPPARMPGLALVPGTSLQAGSSYAWNVNNADPNVPVILMVDLFGQGTFLGMPLPVPLFDIGNPALPNPLLGGIAAFRFPAPGCSINVSPAAMLFAVADAAGSVRYNVGVPPGRRFVGLSFDAQAMAFSQTANPMQAITSDAQRSTVCGPLGVTRIYQFGGPSIQVGQVSFGQGAVIELR